MYQIFLYVSVIVFNTGISTNVVERGIYNSSAECTKYVGLTIHNERNHIRQDAVPQLSRVEYVVTGKCVYVPPKLED